MPRLHTFKRKKKEKSYKKVSKSQVSPPTPKTIQFYKQSQISQEIAQSARQPRAKEQANEITLCTFRALYFHFYFPCNRITMRRKTNQDTKLLHMFRINFKENLHSERYAKIFLLLLRDLNFGLKDEA